MDPNTELFAALKPADILAHFEREVTCLRTLQHRVELLRGQVLHGEFRDADSLREHIEQSLGELERLWVSRLEGERSGQFLKEHQWSQLRPLLPGRDARQFDDLLAKFRFAVESLARANRELRLLLRRGHDLNEHLLERLRGKPRMRTYNAYGKTRSRLARSV